MSHVVGSLQTLVTPLIIGPDSGAPPTSPNTWKVDFVPTPAPLGTRFVILHFQNVHLPASNRLEVDLGYDTDVFGAASGADIWTRPVNISAFGGKAPIRYITSGSPLGGATLDRYGRGERSAGEQDPTALSNCDPFLVDLAPGFREPKYDPFWFCNTPPGWQNAACVPAGDIRRTVAASAGMIVDVGPNEHNTATIVSTCSVTLIGPDEILYAGHCVSSADQIRSTGSVCFDYQTDCGGNKPAGYNCRFFKVIEVKRLKWEGSGNADYCILRLSVPPGGLGIPAIPVRFDLPGVNEQVFGIHHPNGSVKKMSPTQGFAGVISSAPNAIRVSLDVSGGSSGSGLYDHSGRIVGVLSNGGPCSLAYYPTATILKDIAAAPQLSPPRDVMMVLDRSGSMSESTSSGGTKIQGARDAATLFTQLIRLTGGHKLGLVSFSSSASTPVDFGLAPVNAANKAALIGKVNLVSPSGATSIGGGLQSAGVQLPSTSPNPRSVLLLTDGMQNSAPLIADAAVQSAIAGVEIDVIGLGTESNIDGPLMSSLATLHGGRYARANTALDLKKYFALAFGDIFENGSLLDPELFLPGAVPSAPPLPFDVCGEESLTVVVGWDRSDSSLALSLRGPGGAVVAGGAGVEVVTGNTWIFLRVPLPLAGERDGTWQALVAHASGGGEFPPPPVDTRYFVNIVVSGGPRLRRIGDTRRRRYTGDRFTPIVALYYPTGGYPRAASVQLEVTGPDLGIGNVLSDAHLGPATVVGGDLVPARQSTLRALEASTGQPVVHYVTQLFSLRDEREFGTGTFEASGVFATPLADLFRHEGNYTFHARATYGDGCSASRELFWTMHVDVGVDPARSVVTVTVLGSNPDGTKTVRIDVTLVDVYGNKLGPGRAEDLPITGATGTVIGPVQDNGDGSYTIPGVWDPGTGAAPGVVVSQPDRPPIEISDPAVPTEEGHGSLVVTFTDPTGHAVLDLADVFVKHFQLSDAHEARRWHTERPLVFRNLIATHTGIYSLQVLPDHHHAVGQFVTIRDGEITRVTLRLRPN